MTNPEYHIKELIDLLSGDEHGWLFKHIRERKLFFGGAIFEVESSNISIPKSEIIGSVKENKFVSVDKKYIAFINTKVKEICAIAVNCIDGAVIILSDRIFRQDKRKIEGYWYSEEEPQFPKPLPNQLTTTEAEEITSLIKIKEAESKKLFMRGLSNSRIDNSYVGSNEYQHENWVWPEGFAEHYVQKYKVRPSNDFLKFLGWLK